MASSMRTVKPLESVVLSVLIPWEMGVARPRRKDGPRIEFSAARLLRRCVRFRASRREAIAGGGGVVNGGTFVRW